MSHLYADSNLPSYAMEYILHLSKKGRKTSTISRYHYDLADFFTWLTKEKNQSDFKTFQRLTTNDIKHYLNTLKKQKQYSDQTIQRVVTVLNQLYKFLLQKEVLHENPITNLPYKTGQLKQITFQDFLTTDEERKLYQTVRSLDGLTPNQQKARPKLIARNESIILLFLEYGLTLQELAHLSMNDVHFEQNTIDIHKNKETKRTISLAVQHKKTLYEYYQTIPAPVRPRYHSHDPFFIAFDFQRNTFRFVYELNAPKRLTMIAIQKMIREECKRAGLPKKSHQHLRNTAVLKAFKRNQSLEAIKKQYGFQTEIALKRISYFYESSIKKSSINEDFYTSPTNR